jgi:hypothetical protein
VAAIAVVFGVVGILEGQVGLDGILVVKGMASALLTTSPPGSQRIVGGGVAGIAIIAVDRGQITVVAGVAGDEGIEIRLVADPPSVIMTGVGEEDHCAGAGRRGVVPIPVDSLKGDVADATIICFKCNRWCNPNADDQKGRQRQSPK